MAYNVSLEDSSPLISYSPTSAWQDTPQGDSSASFYSGSSFHSTSTQGASLSFSFNGTGIWLYGGRRSTYGSYAISIDGQRVLEESARSSSFEFQQMLGGITSLPMGLHDVVLTNTGSQLDLDYMVFETAGSEESTTSTTTFDDSDPHITYSSQWAFGTHPGFYNNSIHYTQNSDASLGFSFTGEAVAIYGTVAPNMGNYSVYLDGVEHIFNAGSDGSSRVLHEKTLLYYANNIGAQTHDIVITANPSSLGEPAWFELDAVSVTSTSTNSLGFSSTPPTSIISDNEHPGTIPSPVPLSNQYITNKGVLAAAVGSCIISILGIIFLSLFCWKKRRADPPSYMKIEEKDVPKVATFSPVSPDLPIQDIEKDAELGKAAPAYREFSAYDSYYDSIYSRSSLSTMYDESGPEGTAPRRSRRTTPNHARNDSISSEVTLRISEYFPSVKDNKRTISSSTISSNYSRSSYSSHSSETSSEEDRRIMINNMPLPPQFTQPVLPLRTVHPVRPQLKRDTLQIPF